jgi:UDP-N-acetylglucosamine 4,6-dehydratase/5-epimerase
MLSYQLLTNHEGSGEAEIMQWDKLNVLVTGGTGSFGKKFTEIMLEKYHPKKLIIFSRDELKQHEMMQQFKNHDSTLRFFLGDVRDRDRLQRAMHGVNVVVHAAALKQVPLCEYNPFEAIMTNVTGSRNVIDAAIDCGVQRAILVSTDKAVAPVNLYGATKLCAEKLFVHGNAYSGENGTRFCVARYGNVVGSRGSVLPLFMEQRKNGFLTITDERMTRFWIALDEGVEFVIRSIADTRGGEIFVPKILSMRISELATMLVGKGQVRVIGIRPGEKVHELLVSEDEARQAREFADRFIITPNHSWWAKHHWEDGTPLADGFRFRSDENPQWLDAFQFCRSARLEPEVSAELNAVAAERLATASIT